MKPLDPNLQSGRPPAQGEPGRKVQVRVILWESVTYLPAPPTRKCRQLIDDGRNSAFWAGRMQLSRLLRPRWVISSPHTGPEVPRCQRTFRSLTRVAVAGSFWSSRHVG